MGKRKWENQKWETVNLAAIIQISADLSLTPKSMNKRTCTVINANCFMLVRIPEISKYLINIKQFCLFHKIDKIT